MKRDFETAEETMEFFVDEFDSQTSKKKKKKSKKSNKELKKEREESKKEREKTREEKLKERKKKKKSNRKKQEEELKQQEEEKKIKQAEENNKEKAKAIAASQEEADSEGWFAHKKVYNEGLLWMARVYIERDKFSLARNTLNRLYTRPLGEEILAKAPVVEAHYYIEKGEEQKAIPFLEKAIERSDSKQDKARFHYIKGQLYHLIGKSGEAATEFKKVIELKPEYEMEFNAQLNQLRFSAESGNVTDASMASFEELLEDDKNLEYHDQIYYSIAMIHLKKGDKDQAMAYLKKASAASIDNASQKTETYYQLALLHDQSQDFAEAKAYYDSTLMTMGVDDIRIKDTRKRRDNLADIAKYVNEIELQDSLLRIASYSDEEKKILAGKLLARQAASKTGDPATKLPGMSSKLRRLGASQSARPQGGSSAGNSNFFAYSERSVKKGKKNFESIWGEISLEDNWRRSNSKTTRFGDFEGPDEDVPDISKSQLDQVFAAVPKNPKQVAETKLKIEKAYFQLGIVYRDRLESYEKSIDAHEVLLGRFPDTEYKMEALYYLYLNYKALGNETKAQEYAQKIITEDPDSKFARTIQDPNYASTLLDERQKLALFYDDTYQLLLDGDYDAVTTRVNQAGLAFGPDNPYQAKFNLLYAMAKGGKGTKEDYIEALKTVIAQFPGTPEATRAKEITRFLKGDESAFEGVSKKDELVERFMVEDDKLHYVICVVFNQGESSLDKIKIAMSDYNKNNFRNDRLRISSIMLDIDTKTPLVLVRKFDDKKEAMGYYQKAVKDKDDIMPGGVEFELFAVTQRNYREIVKQRSVNAYRKFFESQYLN